MQVIKVKGVNEALPAALRLLLSQGVERPSRNGPVLAFAEPVATVYTRPWERVLFSHKRRANPVFHFLESLWMLAGRNDVAFPSTIVKNMKSFTDDGTTYHGAYGYRWRTHFDHDQIHWVIEELKRDPDSRRAVLQMWDGYADPVMVASRGKDVPCNTSIYFDRRGGKLNMLVSCRSNDIIWGAYGANAVHMSVLQEYIANQLRSRMGNYCQMSNDLHLYLERHNREDITRLIEDCGKWNYYAARDVSHPLFASSTAYQVEHDLYRFFVEFDRHGLEAFLENEPGFKTTLFRSTVMPMVRAWLLRHDDLQQAVNVAMTIRAFDWRIAVVDWLGGFQK